MPEETTLIPLENPKAIYQQNQVDSVLKKIEAAATAAVFDISSAKGRDECKSTAYQVARTKTFLDNVGKELTEEARKIVKEVDADRKKIRDTLDAVRDKVRAPLTAWEQEEARKEKIKADFLEALTTTYQKVLEARSSEEKQALLETILSAELPEQDPESCEAKRQELVGTVSNLIKETQIREAEQKELEQLRILQAEQQEKERKAAAELAAAQAALEAEKMQREADEKRRELERAHAEQAQARELEEAKRRAIIEENNRKLAEQEAKRKAEQTEQDRKNKEIQSALDKHAAAAGLVATGLLSESNAELLLQYITQNKVAHIAYTGN